ncbi:hypothetical protein B0H13DRAFT_2324799 [Mycena leptocephala]|nr:hypothetical protein B0H13DRAFT_1872915 [Mycena leptocephala]KAJ7914995.1 hypothetical protein B0H13DRAFT_2324799 [Mycena leptocephala]
MTCVPKGLTFIVDFEGNTLDNSFANAFPPSANNPVITNFLNIPLTLNQQWIFHPITNNSIVSNYTIANGVSGGNTAFLSYPCTAEGHLKRFSQAATQLTFPEAVNFTVNCNPLTGDSVSIIDTVFNLALTSWGRQNASMFAPVTYEAFTGRKEQIWQFQQS